MKKILLVILILTVTVFIEIPLGVSSKADVEARTSATEIFITNPSIEYYHGVPVEPGWINERVDVDRSFNVTPGAIALDSEGYPHIVYGGDRLYYARQTEQGWVTKVMDPHWGRGEGAAIAIDTVSDKVYVVYYDQVNKKLLLNGGVIDSNPAGDFRDIDIAIDYNGRTHISYLDSGNNNLYYHGPYLTDINGLVASNVQLTGGSSIDVSVGGILGEAPYPYISHTVANGNENELRVAYWNQNEQQWEYATIVTGVSTGLYTSLATWKVIDNPPTDFVISYYDAFDETLKSARGAIGLPFAIQEIETTGFGWFPSSVTFGFGTQPSVAYTNGSREVKFAARNENGWQIFPTVFDQEAVTIVGLARDNNGNPHLAYVASESDDLYYSHWTGVAWETEVVETGAWLGSYPSLHIETTAPYTAHISYAGDGLKFATNVEGAWQTEHIIADLNVIGTSLAIEPGFEPHNHIAYYDFTNSQVKYATDAGNGWTIETIDNEGPVAGSGIAIALESTFPYTKHVAYVGDTDIRYATSVSGNSWQTEILEMGGSQWFDSLNSPSLALDSQGEPHIAYHGAIFNGDLTYVYRDAGVWYSEVLTTTGNSFTPVSLVLDSMDNPHIAFAEPFPPYQLHYGYQVTQTITGTVWAFETVTDYFGQALSLALDNEGNPYISYAEFNDTNLYLAYKNDEEWHIETIDTEYDIRRSSLLIDPQNNPVVAYASGTDLKIAWQTSSAVIPLEGGQVEMYGVGTFLFPSGAFTEAVELSLRALEPFGTETHVRRFFELEARSLESGETRQIAPGYTYSMSIGYDDGYIPDGETEADLALFYWTGSQWRAVSDSEVDTELNVVQVTTDRLGLWAVLVLDKTYLPFIRQP